MEISPCTASNGRSTKQFHILMFPALCHGHFSAYAELSKRIADEGIYVSFLTTPLNVPRLKPMLCNHEKIQLLELPLPAVEGLPKDIQCTSEAPSRLWSLLLHAVHLLEKPFEKLLQIIPTPDCIVFDLMPYWTPKIAAKFGIPTVLYLSVGAAYSSYDLSLYRAKCQETVTAEDFTNPPPGYPSSAISKRYFEACSSLKLYLVNPSNGMRGIDQIMACVEGCDAIAIKSCSELEGKFIEYFKKVTAKPVLPVGPLVLRTQGGNPQGESYCLEWLEKQQAGSVVYVSFGSECYLKEKQIHELVLGLEAAQQPFIVVLRLQNSLSAVLPEGFVRWIEQRGLVLGGWAPQMEILRHPSTGAFVTHCGWNSVMEGMSIGLPLIALPMLYDQGLNARLIVEELKVGVEVEREKDGLAKRDQICRAVRRIMVEEEGKEIKHKALDMGNLFRTSLNTTSQKTCIDKFIHHLVGLIPDKK